MLLYNSIHYYTSRKDKTIHIETILEKYTLRIVKRNVTICTCISEVLQSYTGDS